MASEIVREQRDQTVIALAASGLTHAQIAAQLKCSTSTVERALAKSGNALAIASDKLTEMQQELAKQISVKARAERYAHLAAEAKNEAVSLGALQRIDDLDGIVTQKELVRTRRDEQSQPGPMFILPAGASVNFTINQQNNTICSDSVPDNGAADRNTL
jgi:hypothetical protein